MHLALLHDGRPALLRVEGPVGAKAALFFHPFPLHSDVWEELLLACADAGLCAAAIDAPGFGGTPPLGQPLTMDFIAGLGAAALDALGAGRAGVVGNSMGGYAAMAFMRRFPERASSLTLIATKGSADAEAARTGREEQARVALERGPRAVMDVLLPKILSGSAGAALRQRVEALAARATPQGLADAVRGMALRPDSLGEMPRWRTPSLVIAGAEDALMPLADLQAMASALPRARLEIIEGTGHLPYLERPAQVAALLTAHLLANP
jgi:pimeloyl-ACP methyl ester carboxylesterase